MILFTILLIKIVSFSLFLLNLFFKNFFFIFLCVKEEEGLVKKEDILVQSRKENVDDTFGILVLRSCIWIK